MGRIKGNVGAERAVLSGLAQFGKEAYYDVSDIISTNAFSLESNQAIFKSIEKVLTQIEKPDVTSILAAAESIGVAELLTRNKVDIEYVRSLYNFPIKLENIRSHAKQLAKLEIIRKEQSALIEAANSLEEFDGTESVSKILGVAENAAFGIINEVNSRSETGPKQIMDGAKVRIQALMDNPIENIGIPTPWPIFNRLIGDGMRPGVCLIGARPGQGKSTAAICAGEHFASMGIHTLYIDTEMLKEEQENRILARMTQVQSRSIENGTCGLVEGDKEKVLAAIAKGEKIPFYHEWVGGRSFEEIVSSMRRWLYSVVGFNEFGKPNPHVIIYDYFKLMNDTDLNKMQEYQAVGFQISYLSDFCKQYGTPCLAFVQVNRDGITKDTSDILSQSDRLLWLCVSCGVIKTLSKDEIVENGGGKLGNRKLIMLKARFGEPLDEGDYICMQFDGGKTTLKELGTKFDLLRKKDSGFEIDDNPSGEDSRENY